jgi:hypothetical protein
VTLQTELDLISSKLKLHRMQEKMARLYHQQRKKESEQQYKTIVQLMAGFFVTKHGIFRPTTLQQKFVLEALLALCIQRFVLVIDLDYQMVSRYYITECTTHAHMPNNFARKNFIPILDKVSKLAQHTMCSSFVCKSVALCNILAQLHKILFTL